MNRIRSNLSRQDHEKLQAGNNSIGEIAKDVLSLVKGIINLVENVAEIIKNPKKQYMNELKVS
ncbi:putative leucyl aminopeptidase [Rickettsia amblyommatis str. Darkwater]|nr:putative leucyl aminopeptidase [Rickettsia amblyommatis str. Darkwater]